MALNPETMDPKLLEILAWAKGAAKACQSKELAPRHILLGALLSVHGRDLLTELLGEKRVAELLASAGVPKIENPLSGRWPLSSALKLVTDSVWTSNGALTARGLLEEILHQYPNDLNFPPQGSSAPGPPGNSAESEAKVRRLQSILESTSALRTFLKRRVVGQESALRRIADAYFAARLKGLWDAPGESHVRPSQQPFLLTFVGPTGCGKSLAGEVLAEFLQEQGLSSGCLKLDMSVFAESQTFDQLVGISGAYKGAKKGLLTTFVKECPAGVILIKAIEKAHRNTRQVFMEALEAGRLYDNYLKEFVEFSQTTLVFTTALGGEIYDEPGCSGVLSESRDLESSLWEALQGGGLPADVVSRLALGRAALFEHLSGLDMERLAEKTLAEVSSDLASTLGITLGAADGRVLALLALRFSAGGDARRLRTGLKSFLASQVEEVTHDRGEELLCGSNPVIGRLKGIRIQLDASEPLPETVTEALVKQIHVLLVDDDTWKPDLGNVLRWTQVGDRAAAERTMESDPADLVLIDLHIGSGQGDPRIDKGLAILRHFRRSHPETPVYLFSEFPGRRGLSSEALERVSNEGGARGVLSKDFAAQGQESPERMAFGARLMDIADGLRREVLARSLNRQSKIVQFTLEPPDGLALDCGVLPLWMREIKEVVAVSAVDRAKFGWAEVPAERFTSVAGAEQAKGRLKEVVGWLRAPEALREMGLSVPKGILMTGPPGTGKTTLARATAGEAQVPFFAISASEVLNKYIGESEARVRDLFVRARRYAPSILFLDELDSIGGRRDLNGDDVWKTSLLNELLAQMDGFVQSARPVFVLAATNCPEMLDAALTRPGRFDLRVEVPLPNREARVALLKLHTMGMVMEPDIALEALATRLAGLSGAEIRQVCQEAGFIAFREGRRALSQRDLDSATTMVRHGLASERTPMDEGARRACAIHEAGHAVAQHLLTPGEEVGEITILPRGDSLGFVESAETREG
jgi:ATP-dependent 26S proteasome regulatory subunit/DNA-binding NarL/FixJ family response regulator